MICILVYKNNNDDLTGFHVKGHSGYAESGSDIICAAVSALVINTVNSIELLTDDTFDLNTDEESGLVDFRITSELSEYARILLVSLVYGLQNISETYSDYVDFNPEGGAEP